MDMMTIASDEELLRLLKKTEQIVASVESDSLRPVAFSEVLRFFLHEGNHQLKVLGTATTRGGRALRQPRKAAAGTAGRILSLRDAGFFEKPKTMAETQGELRRQGFPYPMEQLSTPLVRLVRQRLLRRLERRDGGKKVFEYCNP